MASIAANSLARNASAMAQSMQRLSTGLRVNSAADDAAGLAISSKMTSQVLGLNQAIRNVNDGIGMIQTAEGSLKEVTELLQRMRELSIQSINGSNTAADRASMDTENQALKAEIDRIGSSTQWNGLNLLSSNNPVSLQVGANASDTLSVSFNTISGATLGVSSVSGGYVSHSSTAPSLVTVVAGSPAGSVTANVISNASGVRDVAAADFDNDGDTDVFVSSHGAPQLAVYVNDGSTSFTQQQIPSTSYSMISSIRNIDVDGDGDLDVVTSTHGTGIIEWHENNGAGGFTSTHAIFDGAYAYDATGADLDGDGDMDLIGLMHDGGELLWFRNDGNQNFSSQIHLGSNQSFAAAVTTGDFNGDGFIDIASTGHNSGSVKIMTNDGAGNFTPTLVNVGSSDALSPGLESIDLDGDGDLDLLVSDRAGDKVYFLDNNGSGTYTQKVLTSANDPYGLAAADLDGDGDIDIAVAADTDNQFLWLENDGSENFTKHVVASGASSAWSVAIADVNGDGTQDIIGGKYGGGAAWYDLNLLTRGVSTLDFGNLGLSLGDRVTLAVTGGTQVQHSVGAGGISQLLASLASDLAAQSSLYSGATVNNNVLTINGLADGSALAGITVTLESPPASLLTVNLLSASSAASGLSVIDESLDSISTYRASFGATLNRLEYSADNLSNAVQNTRASRSRIADADYAKESTLLARTSIIQQASTAMLAQANQQAQWVLELLK